MISGPRAYPNASRGMNNPFIIPAKNPFQVRLESTTNTELICHEMTKNTVTKYSSDRYPVTCVTDRTLSNPKKAKYATIAAAMDPT